MQGQQESCHEISVAAERELEEKTGQKKRIGVPVDYSYSKKEKKITGTNILLGVPMELVW